MIRKIAKITIAIAGLMLTITSARAAEKVPNHCEGYDQGSCPAAKACTWKEAETWTRAGDGKVRTTKAGDQIDASHGSFDNNIDVLTGTLERIRGGALVAPMEWLDY